MGRITNKDRALQFMQDTGSITTYDAIREFGNTRLSATIHCLKKDGYKITATPEVVINRYGEKRYIARYKLVE